MGGKFLVRRKVVEPHVFDRMAEGPMPDVVQQGRAQQDFGPVTIDHLAEAGILAELPQVTHGVVKHAERVLEPRVRRPRIDPRRQPELRDVLQALKLRRVDERANPRRERDIQLHRNPHEPLARFQVGKLGDFKQGMRHALTRPLAAFDHIAGAATFRWRRSVRTPRPLPRAALDDQHVNVGNRDQQALENRRTEPAAIPGALRATQHNVSDPILSDVGGNRADHVGALQLKRGSSHLLVNVSVLVICRCVAASIGCRSSSGVWM